MVWGAVILAPPVVYIAAYLMTGFAVIEFTRHIPYVDWFIEWVANPVLCGAATVIVTAALAPPARMVPAGLWAFVLVTAAVAIPSSAAFLFGKSGLTVPVISTASGAFAALIAVWFDAGQRLERHTGA